MAANPLDVLDEAPSAPPAQPTSALASAQPAAAQNPLDALDEAQAHPDMPPSPGLVQPGTLQNVWDRPVLKNPDGSVSTTLSFSIGTDKGETLIPQVVDGKKLTREEAIEHYRRTGEHLGVFDTPEHADTYAQALHNAQWSYMQGKGTAGGPNPLDSLEQPPASAATAARMKDTTDQAQMPEVTVSAKRPGREASWSEVAAGIPTAIGAGIETKIGGTQEFVGHTAYDDARKKYWQATVLPDAVRDAREQGIALTDVPEVVDTAKHLGIRPDTFTRDWPTYANQTPEQIQQVQKEQGDRIQTGAQQIASGSKKRLTAQQVQELYAPNMDPHSLKSLVFDSAVMVPDILAGVGGTVATGGVGGAAIMAADIAPSEYAAARNKGLSHNDASTYAVLSTLASSVPEVPVLKIVENAPMARKIIGGVVGDKLAETGIGKVAGTTVAQGVTQSVVNALQQGIDQGVLNEHLPLDEALKQVAWSGLVGGVVGAPMGAFHAATSRTPKPTTFRDIPEVGERPQAPSLAPPSLGESPETIDTSEPAIRTSAGASTTQDATTTTKVESGEKNNSAQPSSAVREALQAAKDKTLSPPQADMLEGLGLVKRNDLNEPLLLPVGRRKLVELSKEAEQAATPATPVPAGRRRLTQLQAESGREIAGALNPTIAPTETPVQKGVERVETGSESPVSTAPVVPEPPKAAEVSRNEPEPAQVAAQERTNEAPATENRLSTDQDLRAGLTAMKDETGWSQIGGRVIRDASTDQVTGRTSWIPNADWWPGRPKGLKETEVHAAIDKALAGQPLRKREQAMVDYMTQVHDERVAMARTHEELAAAVPELRSQPEGALDLTLLASRAAEHDPNAAAAAMDLWEDDRPETIARVRGEFERIIGRGQEAQKDAFALSAQEGRAEQPAAVKRSPAALDLFGDDRSKEQALADESKRRDQQRSPNRDVPLETGNPNDLFSQARRQTDFTDQLKAARKETETEPTEAQKSAGNYAKGEVSFAGLPITIENPKGSTRHGVDGAGERWSQKMAHDYGYINRTTGADRDHMDAFLTGKPDTGKVFVVNQLEDAPGKPKFDEHKVILGADSEQEARDTYHANYPKGWRNLGSIAEFTTPEFKEWLKGTKWTQPAPTGKASELQMRSGESRKDYERRKAVSQMTPEEMRRELLTHELTGIPNRRAYEEAKKLPHQVSIDVDSLKWANDNMGHKSGDELLKAIASSLSSHTDNVFHLSGDEFVAQAHTETEAHELMRNVADHLKDASIEVEMPDGRLVKLKGMGVSYGVGKTLKAADEALQSHKSRRQQEGTRAGRGEAPPGATVGTREAGREDQTGHPAEGVEPKSRRTTSSSGLPRAHIERIVHQTVRDAHIPVGFPHVEVHDNVNTLPTHIRDLVEKQGAADTTGAVYDPSTGRIHLIAQNNGSEQEVRENLWHEAVGHHGLRMAMDPPQYNAIMDGINRDMPERVQAAATRNGLDLADPAQKRAAAEEVIAYAAGQQLSGQPIAKPVLPYFTRAVRAVKSFFARMTGKPFYDDRAIAGLIQQARQALERGVPGTVPGEALRSTRAPIFYSPVDRAVTESKQAKASADQWLATIKKMPGVKPEELEWLGLEPWLKEHEGPITREELSNYVRANKLDIQETSLGTGTQSEDEKRQIHLAEELRSKGYELVFDHHGNVESVGVPNFDIDDFIDRMVQKYGRDAIYDRGEEEFENGFVLKPDFEDRISAEERAEFDQLRAPGQLPVNRFFMHDPAESEAAHDKMAGPDSDLLRELDQVSARVALNWLDHEGDNGNFRGTQYAEYTLPGGKNYRELLLRLPRTKAEEVQFEPLKDLPEGYEVTRDRSKEAQFQYAITPPGQQHARPFAGGHPTPAAARRAALDQLNAQKKARLEDEAAWAAEKKNYKTGHWNEPNIVAHTRFNERTDADGKKVLHVEEIQSDWHQSGRKHGYQSELGPEQHAKLKEIDARIKRLRMEGTSEEERREYFQPGRLLTRGTYGGTDKVIAYHPGPEGHAYRWSVDVIETNPYGYPKIGERVRNHATDPADEIIKDLTVQRRQIDSGSRVPDAPFKTSWPMLTMKRLIRWAAENGFERLTWTTGQQQAVRYNLGTVVDGVRWENTGDGRRMVNIDLRDGSPIVFTTNAEGHVYTPLTAGATQFKGHHVSELVGAEVSSRIFGEEKGHITKEGLHSIGGEGMKGFYDQILPRETDKLIKKYGAKVGDMHLSTEEKAYTVRQDPDNQDIWYSLDPNRPLDYREFPTEEAARNDAAAQNASAAAAVHGFDITPEMKQAALGEGFPMFARRQQQLALQQPKGSVYDRIRAAVHAVTESTAVRDVRKLINPAGMSAESRRVAEIARVSLGELAHETVKTQEALEHFSRVIDKTPIVEQLAMMDAIEKGDPQPDPSMQPVADGMRKMLDTWRGKVQGLGEGYLDNFIENYFPHYWREPGEAQRMVASIMGRRPLRGPASFLKMRTIPSIKEGMDAGLTPLTTNPLIMTLLKTREMQRFVTGVTLMRRYKEDGLAQFLSAGKPMPDGWGPINDNIAKVRQWSEVENGFIERGQYIMPIDAARVINNHVSASALRDFAPAQVFRRGANALNAMQLGFSAFHLGFTTLDAMISKNAQGIERLMHGEVGGAVKAFSEGLTPVGAFTNVRRGYKLLQAYSDPAGATPDMRKLVGALEQGGGRAHMDRYYQAAEGVSPFRGVGPRSLVNDVRQALTAPTDKLQNLGRALGNFPVEYANKLMRGMQEIWKTTPLLEVPVEVSMRVVRASTSWIMEHLVPMQKLGVFADLANDHMRRNPLEDPNARAESMQRIWASVDNRLGEMVYDNLFWNRTMKDTLHLAIRAVGWNVGTIREIAGAPIDIVKAVDKGIRTGKISADDLGHRLPYVISMAATTALYSAVYQYLATGQGPQELKDYFFPRTGGVTNYGTPERVSLPSYVKDVYEYSQRPGTTVMNKLNPIFSLIGNLYSNQDFFGNPITDPEASYWHQKLQQLQFAGHEMTPFSLQGRQQMQATEAQGGFGATVRKTLPMVGITPAPGYITSGEQMERRKRLEDDQKYTGELKYQIKKALLAHDKETATEKTKEYTEAVKRMAQTKKLVEQDRAKAAVARRKAAITMRRSGLPATANLVASLPLEPDAAARDYFTHMTKESAA